MTLRLLLLPILLPPRLPPCPAPRPLELAKAPSSTPNNKRPRFNLPRPSSIVATRRSVTPSSRNETPKNSCHRIPKPTATSPKACIPLAAKPPTARVLFDLAPSPSEKEDFFAQVETQIQEEFGGRWRLAMLPEAAPTLLMPSLDQSDDPDASFVGQ